METKRPVMALDYGWRLLIVAGFVSFAAGMILPFFGIIFPPEDAGFWFNPGFGLAVGCAALVLERFVFRDDEPWLAGGLLGMEICVIVMRYNYASWHFGWLVYLIAGAGFLVCVCIAAFAWCCSGPIVPNHADQLYNR